MPSVPSCTGLLPSGNVSASKSFSPLSCFSVRVFSHSNRKETNTRLNPNLRMKLFYKKHYSNTCFYPASTQICISTPESLALSSTAFVTLSFLAFVSEPAAVNDPLCGFPRIWQRCRVDEMAQQLTGLLLLWRAGFQFPTLTLCDAQPPAIQPCGHWHTHSHHKQIHIHKIK